MANKNSGLHVRFFWVDAFTHQPFRGNAAAVCILDAPVNTQIMQSIATEIGLSETAFVYGLNGTSIKKGKRFSLKWFTPKVEVELCGHATLASASVLFNEIEVAASELIFKTRSGELKAKKLDQSISLDFPAETFKPALVKQKLLDAIGISKIEDSQFSKRLGMLLIKLPSENDVRRLQPDFEGMNRELNKEVTMGVIVTSRGNQQYDFVSRFFAPKLGLNEDPVTGSSHSVLTPYWSRILGKTAMSAFQASRRGGELRVRLKPENRVEIAGETFILFSGKLRLPSSSFH
jgi:PhzF family phenazine biosynthesis protein